MSRDGRSRQRSPPTKRIYRHDQESTIPPTGGTGARLCPVAQRPSGERPLTISTHIVRRDEPDVLRGASSLPDVECPWRPRTARAYHRAVHSCARRQALAVGHAPRRWRLRPPTAITMATVALVVVACASSTTSGPSGSLPPASGLSVPLSTASAPPSTGAGYDVPTPEPVNSVAVPEVPCPTTFALPTETLPPLPKTMTATVTPAVAGRVTYYGNGTLTALGPKDWHCEASVGIDGSARMTITPPGQPARSASPAPTGSILTSPRQEVYEQALTAASAGPCVGCVVAMACGLFPEALNLMAQPGLACSSAPPAGEQVTRPQPRSAVFMDPPGVAGTGDPRAAPTGRSGSSSSIPAPRPAAAVGQLPRRSR